MNKVELSKLSLRDLAILAALVDVGRIGPVALRFGISNSAVSYALERLRMALDDSLLIRKSHGFHPTERGQEYGRLALKFINEIKSIGQEAVFDPVQETRHFRLVATDYELQGFLGETLKSALALGAGLSFGIVETDATLDATRLHRDLDLALVPTPLIRAGLTSRHLFSDPYRVFYDPLMRAPLAGVDDYCAAGHALVDHGAVGRSNVDLVLESMSRKRNVRLVAPNFSALAALMRATDLITTLPSRFGDGVMAGFASQPAPIELEHMSIYLVRSKARDGDAGLNYLCDQLLKSVGARRN